MNKTEALNVIPLWVSEIDLSYLKLTKKIRDSTDLNASFLAIVKHDRLQRSEKV